MMHLLALVPGGIGDQLLFFPTLDSIKQQYPDASIDVVVEPRSAGAYRVYPAVKKVWSFDFKGSNSLADWANLLGNMREQEYDAVISLGRSYAVGLLLWLTGIPTRVAFSGQGNGYLSAAVAYNPDQYAAATYHDLLKGLNIHTPCPPVKITLAKSDLDWAESEQKRLGVKDSGYILLHGGSSALAKKKGIDKIYPAESWIAVIHGLQKKLPNIPVVVIAGSEDQDLVNALKAKLPNILTTSPPDIGKLAAEIASANLLLCTDSGPMHIGVAVGTALVALFGPTEPERLLPLDTHKQIKFVKAPAGKPIGSISPQDILATIWSK